MAMVAELAGAISALGALWATYSLALQGTAAGAITENTTVSVGLLVVAGATLIAFAWRAGRKSADIESKLEALGVKLDGLAEKLGDHMERHE